MANLIRVGGCGGGSSTLITKSITQNGTYLAQDDNADGYSEVSVNVSGGNTQTQFRYLKWHITDNGNNNNVLQIAEVEFRNENDVAFTMPTGFTATSSMSPYDPEDDVYVLFDGTDRKLVILPFSGTSVEDITIDLGAGNYLDISEYPYFCWKSGNDDSQYFGRAPRVWQLYGANQSDFSDAVLLDDTTIPINTQNLIWCYKSRMILNVLGGSTSTFTVESDDTPISTSTATATVEEGGIYLFSTVYNGREFSNVKILAGNNTAVYTVSSLGRMWTIVKAESTTVTYNWYGDICPNLYNKIEFEENGINIDDDIAMVDYAETISNPFTANVGELFIVGTDGNSFSGTFTGADVICHNLLGSTDSNRTAFFLVKATAQSITYSGTIRYIARLVVGKDISKITSGGDEVT